MNAPAGATSTTVKPASKLKPVSKVAEGVYVPNETLKALEENLISRIRRQTGCKVRCLGVKVESGVIRISGFCWTFYTKQLAQQAIMALAESEVIINDIKVEAP